MKILLFILLISSSIIYSQPNKNLQELAKSFFEWRIITQPISGDDIPRIERPSNWLPNFSAEQININKEKYLEFKKSLDFLPHNNFSRSDSVDFLLTRSAIERINWELNILKLPNTHPEFYIDQSLGGLIDLLVISSPFTKERAKNFVKRLDAIPQILTDAKQNLNDPIKPFAQVAISQLNNIEDKLAKMSRSLVSTFPSIFDETLISKSRIASSALNQYTAWLIHNLDNMKVNIPVGRKNYIYFLKNIALVPHTPEELLAMGKMEFQRSVVFGTLESTRNNKIDKPKMLSSIEEEIRQALKDEQAIRNFLIENKIMSVPNWTKNYTLKKLPEYIEALADYGELDDFTSPTRLDENSVRYIPPPSDDLGYFYKTAATDPRPLIIHEGTPGHYFQLIQTWKNQNPIRRFYFDSNSNEGIAFYFEEMMLQLGLFDNIPQTREVIYNFMKLRSLRVDVDINLALGNYSINDAGQYLASTVPMDIESASQEAAFFALTPGQAITYQIGKIQLMKLMSDAKISLGEKFILRDFHDYILQNGNVPISLLRWEYLGKTEEIKKLWN